jgi:hypothetical protein
VNDPPSLRATAAALAEAGRLAAFRQAHPGAELSHPKGRAQVYVPHGSGCITVTRDTAGEALDAAEVMLAEGEGT